MTHGSEIQKTIYTDHSTPAISQNLVYALLIFSPALSLSSGHRKHTLPLQYDQPMRKLRLLPLLNLFNLLTSDLHHLLHILKAPTTGSEQCMTIFPCRSPSSYRGTCQASVTCYVEWEIWRWTEEWKNLSHSKSFHWQERKGKDKGIGKMYVSHTFQRDSIYVL